MQNGCVHLFEVRFPYFDLHCKASLEKSAIKNKSIIIICQ